MSAAEITKFSFQELTPLVIAKIDETNITATLPVGAKVTDLKATFVTTGISVTVKGQNQISGTTPNDFTYPVI